jgi:hypothetical protein
MFNFQLPLQRYNLTNAVQMTQHVLDVMGTSNKLDALAIGNEVDVYNSSYGARKYSQDLKAYIDAVTNNVTGLPSGRIFQIFDKATDIDWPTSPLWTMSDCFPSSCN